MANQAEEIKTRYGDPFKVLQAIERAAVEGFDTLSEDDLFMSKWLGLYTHRYKDMHHDEKGYFMLRTKQPGGFVTPEQIDVVADIAEKQNKGFADITTRQDFQLHWVHYKDAPGILKRLQGVGITTIGACGDIARNICGCPVAGVDREEIVDASPVIRELNEFFHKNADTYCNLPRKYKISVSGCRTWCIHPEIQCVALTATTRAASGKTEIGYDLRVGGGLSTQAFVSQRLGAFVLPKDVVEVVRHITEIWRDAPEYREKRHHARIKYLVNDWGAAKLRQVLEERLGRRLDDTPADFQEPEESYRDHVGVHAQKQAGLFYVGMPVTVGRITSAQMKKIGDLCRRHGDGKSIRLTNRQNILLLNVPEANVERVLEGLRDVGLSINVHPIRRSVVTCTGIQFCKLALVETKSRSQQIVDYLERRVALDEPLRVHITGCPNACAQYQIGHIGMMGTKVKVDGQMTDAFDVWVGGQMGRGAGFNHVVLRRVPAMECAKRLEGLLLGFKKQRKPKESFNAWCARVGDEALVKLLTELPAKSPASVEEVSLPKVPESDGPVFGP